MGQGVRAVPEVIGTTRDVFGEEDLGIVCERQGDGRRLELSGELFGVGELFAVLVLLDVLVLVEVRVLVEVLVLGLVEVRVLVLVLVLFEVRVLVLFEVRVLMLVGQRVLMVVRINVDVVCRVVVVVREQLVKRDVCTRAKLEPHKPQHAQHERMQAAKAGLGGAEHGVSGETVAKSRPGYERPAGPDHRVGQFLPRPRSWASDRLPRGLPAAAQTTEPRDHARIATDVPHPRAAVWGLTVRHHGRAVL